ncbi:OLC1v1016081C1 [Oldenlandia corymbosa var. corymbosa]|uniref:OLC1v1016081C1 n=1 Tax=Oldenlandia corymbosa var. corymbosa TaxID=529605 RepID=A0AAV1E5N4_OLDCO|nr:OLC1v1016081C1 [Oldenlandia corymbosa var. corymbosa]
MAAQNMDQFEAFFRRADLDQDGKISGAEAVSFFQGSNLSKQVLAQIWMHADQSHTGFLSRQEFYNALKLVTVAQSKRELTADIVKAALYGPASAKIPPPQINLAALPAPQLNPGAPTPTTQLGGAGVSPVASQNVGVRGSLPPNTGMGPQYLPSKSIQTAGPAVPSYTAAATTRPPVPTPMATTTRPSLGVSSPGFPRGGGPQLGPSPLNSGMSNDWLGGGAGPAGNSVGPTGHVFNRAGPSPAVTALAKPQDPKALTGPGNGVLSDSMFGGGSFSATQTMPQQPSLAPTNSLSSTAISSAAIPKPEAPESSTASDPFAALRSTYKMPSTGTLPQQTKPLPKPNQQSSTAQVAPSYSAVGGGGSSTSDESQAWPKMTRAGIQKYAKVFMEVDSFRDGKIRGEQARNLFMSWRLPMEVLKQVWDLSDQDSDSMLSLREFCIALYLMERYREGRTLPSTLPSSIMLDDTLLSMAGPPTTYGSTASWGPNPGPRPQQGMPGSQPLMHPGVRPGLPQQMQMNQKNARGPLVENSNVNMLSNGERNSLDNNGPEATDTEKKVEDKENLILDSREKLEYYRTKMQDLVLYKSRCDNRLNEITERARADKQEAELLGKKYEEKYKQVAEIASKLTIEEAAFRDIQERKQELHQAIIKVEQGGSADGILQVRADRIQSDLEELLKALAERSKKRGVEVKSTALIELPPGWQPGIPENASVWDEDWDKFEDEGFSFDVTVPANSKITSHENGSSSPINNTLSPDVMSHDDRSERGFTQGDPNGFEAEESLFGHSDDESKSPRASPARHATVESPPSFSDDHFRKSFDADSESHRGFDESWVFENNDDVDSVWGFGTKDTDHNKKQTEDYFFGSSDFGASPTRTESPQADNSFQRNTTRIGFEDSVPGSPVSRAGNSPRGGDPFFDSFSRYDSFSSGQQQDRGRETLTRFDSINSTRSFDHGRGGFSFDDSDPFGSSGPFKVSSSGDSQTPKKGSDSNWSSF